MSGNVPASSETNVFRLVQSIRDLFAGRRNTTGSFTLRLNQSTTTVAHENFGVDSVPTFTPMHASAAAEIGAGTMYLSARAPGSFTITHASSSTANRTFAFTFDG